MDLFPERIPPFYLFLFASVLVLGEYLEGTPGGMCVMVFCYVLVAGIAFNIAGGLRTPTGAYVFFNAVLTALLGLVAKFFLAEPVQSNLQDGRSTMLVYLLGECAIFAAVFASRRLVLRKPLLANLLSSTNADQIALGCILIGAGLPTVFILLGLQSALSTISQLNQFTALAILVSVFYRVKQTGGRSSFTWPALIASMFIEYQGITSASKQALFTPAAAWLLAAFAAGYRPSRLRLLTIGAALYGMSYVLVPYSQYGRQFRENGLGAIPLRTSIDLLSRPLEVRKLALAQGEEQLSNYFHWFNHAEGILDRLNIVCIDDPLINVTNQGSVAGLHNLWLYIPNAIPSFLYRNKPFLYFGNQYAREIGAISPDDVSTAVSFSPFAEAYHTGRWVGLLLIMPLALFGLFTIADSIAGRVEHSPWPLFYTLAFGHIAPEGGIGSIIYAMTQGTVIIIAGALVSVYVTPIFGSILARRPRLGASRAIGTVQSVRRTSRSVPV